MLTEVVFALMLLVCLFVVDDLFIDAIAFAKRLGPKKLTSERLAQWRALPERNIAIVVANWHEAEVIGRMIGGNVKRLQYTNYHFFIGVYPNDPDTWIAAKQVAAFHSNVHVVVNSMHGPTSKGQMLNEIAREIVRTEPQLGIEFDIFLMHDSEDILHPLSLKMINAEIVRADFLQIPVFSFDRPVREWVGSTYIDEFAEIHTKDLFVREALGASIPSAGVGTALRRQLMLTLMAEHEGNFLREDSLTEDYVLGMSAMIKGFKTAFACWYVETEKGRDFIATREYFPEAFKSAVRQKTRWLLGIVFQGRKIVPWSGPLVHRYFLYRDRRGPLNNVLAMAMTALSVYLIFSTLLTGRAPEFMSETWFVIGSSIATTGMISRLLHRMRAVALVNGARRVWAVPFRWPVGNLINFLASIRAIKEYHRAVVRKEPLKWAKTTHVLPADFGHSTELEKVNDATP